MAGERLLDIPKLRAMYERTAGAIERSEHAMDQMLVEAQHRDEQAKAGPQPEELTPEEFLKQGESDGEAKKAPHKRQRRIKASSIGGNEGSVHERTVNGEAGKTLRTRRKKSHARSDSI